MSSHSSSQSDVILKRGCKNWFRRVYSLSDTRILHERSIQCVIQNQYNNQLVNYRPGWETPLRYNYLVDIDRLGSCQDNDNILLNLCNKIHSSNDDDDDDDGDNWQCSVSEQQLLMAVCGITTNLTEKDGPQRSCYLYML